MDGGRLSLYVWLRRNLSAENENQFQSPQEMFKLDKHWKVVQMRIKLITENFDVFNPF